MKPFVLLQSRPENETSDDEYAAFLRYSGLSPDQLKRIRIEQAPMPKLELDQLSGIFVGGGPFNFTDKHKSALQARIEREMHELLDEVIHRDYPFLGACYGIGLLTSHQGGVMSRRYAEGVGPMQIDVIEDDPILSNLEQPFVSLLGHKEACEMLPAGATLLASSATCPIQMFRIKSNIYATQFHPELDADGLAERVHIYKNHGYFPPKKAASIIATSSDCTVTEPMKLLKNFVGRYSE